MRIYKPKKPDGTPYQKWYIEIPDHRGKARRFTGYKDKRLTEDLGKKIELLVNLKQINEPLTPDLAKWLEAAPRNLKEQLLRIGLLEQRQAQAGRPLDELLKQFIEAKKLQDFTGAYLREMQKLLKDFFANKNCTFWTDVDSQKLQSHLASIKEAGKSYRMVNKSLKAFRTFHNWLLDRELIARPLPGLRGIKLLDEKQDRRKVRRSLTIDELERLIQAARHRTLQEFQKVNRGPNKGKQGAKLAPETEDKLRLIGLGRALTYKTAFLTGLRRSELASITVKDVRLRAIPQKIVLQSQNEKNRNGSELPLRKDLAAEIADYIKQKGLAPEDPVFIVPNLKTLKRDLSLAGIQYEDESGRTVDFHALRTCFATHLSKAGIGPRTAQAALRHSSIELTMQTYTDPKLLDVSGALDCLPSLAIDGTTKKHKKLG